MANCPNCGSSDITLKRDTNVSWGRAFVGYALFGVVGGAVGAVTGEDRNVNACLDCGSTWRAETLYQILQTIEKNTNVKLDLSMEKHRTYLNKFIQNISPYTESTAKAISDAKKQFNQAVGKEYESETVAILAISIIFVFPLVGSFTQSLLISFLSTIATIIFGAVATGESVAKKRRIKVEKLKRIEANTIAEADNKLQWAMSEFRNSHQSLIDF